jgi:sortase A
VNRLRRGAALALLALTAWLWGGAGYIHAKACVAQMLLDRAWTRAQATGNAVKPWPWADTTPLAKLEVPRLDVSEIVLRGDSGRTLAFGPAWNEGTALPGARGTTVISGHRDTHFSFLQQLRPDDRIAIDGVSGRRWYRVMQTRIVDANTTRIDATRNEDSLLLVTCYPFDAIVAGGPLRYVVRAEAVDPAFADTTH